MAFLSPGQADEAAEAGVQVIHTNVVWPYYPLRANGGGLSELDAKALGDLVAACRAKGMRLSLGLPPFPPANLLLDHPDWRVDPDGAGEARRRPPSADDLGTRIPCNLGPWGDYLIQVCAELIRDYGVDAFSFDGNYHPALCFCAACKAAYQSELGRAIPARANLDDLEYREYLIWRGEKLEAHYLALQRAIKAANPDAALMSWAVNSGRYGHLMSSPRSMPARMTRLFDLPMQEWWLDESNLGGSIAPAFGASYLRAQAGDGPCASEAYLMSRGNPYGTDSFPAKERLARVMLNITCGGVLADSLGWPGHAKSAQTDFRETARRERWMTNTRTLAWAGILVSEQTRQFFAYRNLGEHFLPHVYGAFRAAAEEHLPFALLNDWDISEEGLAKCRVVILPGAAALSDAQAEALRRFVAKGGGLVATAESTLCDELGRPRGDFALADLFGVSFRGRARTAQERPAMDDVFWNERSALATLEWDAGEEICSDARFAELVPGRSVKFRGPIARVSAPAGPAKAFLWMRPEGTEGPPLPAGVARPFGAGRVVYLAASLDAALWSYSYPYQRRLLTRAIGWAAGEPPAITVEAPMCVLARHYVQEDASGRRAVIHLYNGINSSGGHGLPAMEVPLREEFVAVHGITVSFSKEIPRRFHAEPGGIELAAREESGRRIVEMPPLELHTMLVGDY